MRLGLETGGNHSAPSGAPCLNLRLVAPPDLQGSQRREYAEVFCTPRAVLSFWDCLFVHRSPEPSTPEII
jgi:hypothetical protein